MLDALWLATPLQSGGVLWSPRGLADRDETPDRVLQLFSYIQRGRNQPAWGWWRPEGKWQYGHQYRASFAGVPNENARCGYDPFANGPVDAWEHYDDKQCPACLLLERGEDRSPAALNRASILLRGDPDE